MRFTLLSWLSFYCLFLVFVVSSSGSFTIKRTTFVSYDDQVDAVKELVSRIIGVDKVNDFQYEIIDPDPVSGLDVFEIDAGANGIVLLRGNTGVSIASAFNWYLNYYANCSISWGRDRSGDNVNPLPSPLPLPPHVRVVSPVKYRYYMNVCTVSYSSVWWDWSRWEREIDWMAMSGYNLILSFTGQEYIESLLYKDLGLTTSDLQAQFSGPAFHAWERMGNMRAWGGPLDNDWITGQSQLQLQILQRQKSLGMISVLPGFAGHVPEALTRLFPNASITRSPNWGGFPEADCCDYLLAPVDPLFAKIGAVFVQKQIEVYGFTDHIYNADTFNEMRPASNDPTYLANTAKAVLNAMKTGDPDAKWLMQGWLFQDSDFWKPDTIKAYLGGVANEDMLILDLYSDESPIFPNTQSYFGKDFIWCMLHNFGGTRGIYGLLDHISSAPIETKNNPSYTMVGTGITMEAIEQNPVVYTLMSEMGWRSTLFNTSEWLSRYVERRYGTSLAPSPSLQRAWVLFHLSEYSLPWSWDRKSLMERTPDLSLQTYRDPNITMFLEGWRLFVQSQHEMQSLNGPWKYDAVDFTRQVLSNLFVDVHGMFTASYNRGDLANSFSLGNKLLQLIQYQDRLLGTDPNFLVGNWIEDAKKWAKNDQERVLYEFNARNQITLWGPTGQINDYASKAWAGLYGQYYFRRWSFFIDSIYSALEAQQPFNSTSYYTDLLLIEQQWNVETFPFSTTPTNDTTSVVSSVLSQFFTSPTSSHYTVLYNTDAPLNDIYRAWTNDVQQMQLLCDFDSTCRGFNTNGYIKNSVASTISSPGSNLYVKQQ